MPADCNTLVDALETPSGMFSTSVGTRLAVTTASRYGTLTIGVVSGTTAAYQSCTRRIGTPARGTQQSRRWPVFWLTGRRLVPPSRPLAETKAIWNQIRRYSCGGSRGLTGVWSRRRVPASTLAGHLRLDPE